MVCCVDGGVRISIFVEDFSVEVREAVEVPPSRAARGVCGTSEECSAQPCLCG